MDAELVSGHEAFGQALEKLFAGTHRELALLSAKLDPRLYAHPAALDTIQQFALRINHRDIRILIADARAAVSVSNPLLELARRLPSRFELRELAEEQRGAINSEWLLADAAAQLLERLSPDHLDASYYAHPSSRSLQRLKEFDLLWETAQPSLELSGLR